MPQIRIWKQSYESSKGGQSDPVFDSEFSELHNFPQTLALKLNPLPADLMSPVGAYNGRSYESRHHWFEGRFWMVPNRPQRIMDRVKGHGLRLIELLENGKPIEGDGRHFYAERAKSNSSERKEP